MLVVVRSKKDGTNKINHATKTGYYYEIFERVGGMLCLVGNLKKLHF